MTMRGPGGARRRPSGWPVLRTPRWMLAGGVVLVAGLTLAAIPHRPSTGAAGRRPARHGARPERRYRVMRGRSQRFDRRAAGHPVRRESRRQDRRRDRQHGRGELLAGQQHADGRSGPVPGAGVAGLLPYADGRQRPCNLGISPGASGSSSMSPPCVTAKTPGAVQRASAQLRHDQQALDAERAVIDKMFTSASTSLSAHVSPPSLPS